MQATRNSLRLIRSVRPRVIKGERMTILSIDLAHTSYAGEWCHILNSRLKNRAEHIC